MKTIIATATLNEYPTAHWIINELKNNQEKYHLNDDRNTLYFGFPQFIGYEDKSIEPNLLILSKRYGLLVIRFSNNINLSKDAIEDISDELYSLLFSKLNESKRLRKARTTLSIPLETCVYIEGLNTNITSFQCSSLEDIIEKLDGLATQIDNDISDEIINEAKAILEGTKALSQTNVRVLDNNDTSSKAYIISQLDNEIKTFDFNQLQSAVSIISGPQRIRGLAGSGKTVVLAMKAAQIHMNEPNKKILFTFYTKSLYQQIKNLITKFYRHYKKIDPNWDNLHIKHAWGGAAGLDGVYYSSSLDSGIHPIKFSDALNMEPSNPFGYVCQKAVDSKLLREKYDYVLIDEAQDLPESFFKLVYNITKFDGILKDEKNIVWGYDDLQNIFMVKTKTPKELFGADPTTKDDYVDLDRSAAKMPSYINNDIVLYKCYRNPRSILLTAHALGFGIYEQSGALPVQILENKEHWEDLGYKVVSEDFSVGSHIVVERPVENSPLSISEYCDERELIKCHAAEGEYFGPEIKWVVEEIKTFIDDGLKPEDILVIALDDRYAKSYFRELTAKLLPFEIMTNDLLLNPYTATDFSRESCITLSTVHRAKGNEAAVVFVVGIDALYKDRNKRAARNKIFTAFTRAKGWLRVSGMAEKAKYFFHEIDKALENYPNLIFTQPDLKEVNTLQRDLTDKSKKLKEIKEEMREKLKLIGLSEDEIIEQIEDMLKKV